MLQVCWWRNKEGCLVLWEQQQQLSELCFSLFFLFFLRRTFKILDYSLVELP